MKTFAIAILILASSGCPKPGPSPVTPVTPVTPVPVDASTDVATCASACEVGFSLGCDKSARCVPACENVRESGVFSYDLPCLTRARDCASWDRCFP